MQLACCIYYDTNNTDLVILFLTNYAAIKIMSSQLKLELRRGSRYMVCLALPKMINSSFL